MPTPDSTASAEPPGAPVEQPTDAIFARIARRYDLINRLLAAGRDQAWRRSVIERLPRGRVLDLGAGTGAAVPLFGSREVVALDPVSQMLDLNPTAARVMGKGEDLPFRDGSFDAVFSAFVFRNLDSVETTLGEIARVLRPGGSAGVVGLTRPKGKMAASIHRAGTAIVVPIAGALIDAVDEYRYLHRSLDKLPPPEQLFADTQLQVDRMWRMGPLGNVYGAILTK